MIEHPGPIPYNVPALSQLLDKVRRLSRATSPLGFRAASGPAGTAMLLIAFFAPDLPVEEVDAWVVEGSGGLPEAVAKQAPWGTFLARAEPKAIGQLKEGGCDFLVLGTETPAELLMEKVPGKWLAVGLDLSLDLARGLNSLPVEGVVLDLAMPLSVQHLMGMHSLSSLLHKPLIARVSPELSSDTLSVLAEAGVRGVVVKVNPDQLKGWRQAMASLPQRRPPGEAILPPLQELR